MKIIVTRRYASGLLLSAATAFPLRAHAERRPFADAIFVNGKILTVDDRFSIATAFAIKDNRFLAVGSDRVRQFAGPATRIIDLQGHTVLPGLIDSHAHLIGRPQALLSSPSLAGAESISEIVERIAQAVRVASPGQWIVTTPIGEAPDFFGLPERLAERHWPDRTDLDRASPRNPVYIPSPGVWPYPAILNSAALAAVGIDRDTADELPMTRIVKDRQGEPNGQVHGFHNYNTDSLLFRRLRTLLPPPPSPAIFASALSRVFQDSLAVGLTTVADTHLNRSPRNFTQMVQHLHATGAPVCRTVSSYDVPKGSAEEVTEFFAGLTDARGAGTGDEFAKIQGATVILDGATQFGASWMDQPYLDPYGEMVNGTSAFTSDELLHVFRTAAVNNVRLNILAAGAKACAQATSLLAQFDKELPGACQGWMLQHFQHPTREMIAILGRLGLVVQTYASVDFSKGTETYVARFPGRDIWKTVVPFRWWIDGGVTVAGSSDGAHYSPLFQIWETLERVDGRTGKSMLTPAKAVSIDEAICIHSINGARVLNWDRELGSIEAGKLADFLILDRDILTVPLADIPNIRVLVTVVNGRVAHRLADAFTTMA